MQRQVILDKRMGLRAQTQKRSLIQKEIQMQLEQNTQINMMIKCNREGRYFYANYMAKDQRESELIC